MDTTVTSRDIEDRVTETLTDQVGEYNVPGIVAELLASYDLVGDDPSETLESIDPDTYWTVVGDHAYPDRDDPSANPVFWPIPSMLGLIGKVF